MRRGIWIGLIVLAVTAGHTLGVGVLVPKDKAVPPLAVKYLRVEAAIDDQVARTRVEQSFQNSTNRDLEANYVFPLPAGASVSDFAMWMNGKRVSGEVVEKGKAAQVYRTIVARMRDPGLLEYLGNNLFRANVYPVPKKGTVKIQIEYSQVVPMESGLARYTFPLRTGEKASRTLEDFSVTVRLASKVALKSVYSPTHRVGIKRKDDHHAVVGMEVDAAVLDQDFSLYYSVSKKDFGLNLLTHRIKGEPGYFLLMIAPATEVEEAKVAAKDVVFVLDVSGSMNGPKIEQAKKALSFCVSKLRAKDRFGLITFSTDTDALAKELLPATDANKKKAADFIGKLEATGGTDINSALEQALKLEPNTVIFLTDGKPTVGVTDHNRIVANVEKGKGRARVFVFGVDERVSTKLLDRISEATGGTREYVTPSEDIEVKVSRFFNKASSPVLSQVSLDLGKVETADVYPQAMPDLFRGEQVLVVGRYKNALDSAVILRGEINGEKKSFTYEGAFPAEAAGADFIEGLWARRKVGYLLDQIRLHGENKELKDEVIRLSRTHNIITPYTSYLVLEGKGDYGKHGIALDGGVTRLGRIAAARERAGGEGRPAAPTSGGAGGPARPSPAPPAKTVDELLTRREGDVKAAKELERLHDLPGEAARPDTDRLSDAERKARAVYKYLARGKKDMAEESGVSAMDLSKRLQQLKNADRSDDGRGRAAQGAVRTVAGRRMVRYYGFWIDANWTAEQKRVTVKYAGDAYFKLLAAEPKLKDLFKLGTRLIIVMPSRVALVITEDDGKDVLTDAEIKSLLTPAPPKPEK